MTDPAVVDLKIREALRAFADRIACAMESRVEYLVTNDPEDEYSEARSQIRSVFMDLADEIRKAAP